MRSGAGGFFVAAQQRPGDYTMAVVISLREIADAIDGMEATDSYLNPDSGEIVTISDDEWALAEDATSDGIAEWEKEAIPKLRKDIEDIESGRLLALPGKFEVNDWSIMADFAREKNEGELVTAIHGPGAFRRFRAAVEHLDLLETWYEFRGNALEQIARDWLINNKLEFKEDGRISGRPHEKRISRKG
jgi:hypothetical protein